MDLASIHSLSPKTLSKILLENKEHFRIKKQIIKNSLHTSKSRKKQKCIQTSTSKKFDIIFLNQLSEEPLNGSKDSSLRKLKNQKKSGKKIILRAINLKLHSYNHNIYHAYLDFRLINFMNNYVDFVIFQSEYQRNFF